MILASLTLPPRDAFDNPQPLPPQYVSKVVLPSPGTVIITASAGTVIDAYSPSGKLLGSGTTSLTFSTTEVNIIIVFTKPSAGIITVELLPVAGDGTVPTPPGSGDVLTSTGSAPSDYGWAPPELNSNATELQGVAISSTPPTDGQTLEYNGTEWVPTTPATPSSGGLLARTSYNPASAVTYTLGASMAAVDTTNLSVSFTAPSSGNVLVALEAAIKSGGNGDTISFGVINGGALISSAQLVYSSIYASRSIATMEISGLTPGNSYTYDFGAVAPSTGSLYAGGSYGSASIAVWEAP